MNDTSGQRPFEPLRSPGYAHASRLVWAGFSGAPIGTRAHVLGRFLSCPFLRTFEVLPRGSILDVGGGHGLFARLAIEGGAERVTVVEPDARKIPHAWKHERIEYVAGYADAVTGSFDAVTLFDVLYRIPLDARASLYENLRARSRPGGVVMIKDLDPTARLKFGWNWVQEFVSDRFLGLTLGDAFTYEAPEKIEHDLAAAGFHAVRSVRIDRGYPHSHIAFVARG